MDWLERILKYLIILFISLLVIVISIQVFYRYILSNPIGWTGELSRYLFIWSSLFAAAIGIRKKAHIGVDIVVEKFPERLKIATEYLIHILLIGFFIILIYQGYLLSQKTLIQTSPTLGVKMGYIYLALPVFGFLSILFTLEQMTKKLKGGAKDGNHPIF